MQITYYAGPSVTNLTGKWGTHMFGYYANHKFCCPGATKTKQTDKWGAHMFGD